MKTPPPQGQAKALLPILLLILLSLGSVLYSNRTGVKIPPVVIFFTVGLLTLFMTPEERLADKVERFAAGVGHGQIVTMVLIFLLAGIFGELCKGIQANQDVVHFFLSFVPHRFMVSGIFLVGCVVSFALGTSNGAIVAVGPIALSYAEVTGVPVPLVMGAVLSGGLFGDNLSFVSDTTICATQICEVPQTAKFRANLLLAAPAAVLAAIAFAVLTPESGLGPVAGEPFHALKILPYLAILVLALLKLHVIVVLALGIAVTVVLGLFLGEASFQSIHTGVYNGILGMAPISLVVLIMGGILAQVRHNGGLAYLLGHMQRRVKTARQAELSIAGLVCAVTLCVANNTMGIITAGPIVKGLADQYRLSGARAASLLDIVSCVTMGLLVPYGGMLLTAAGLARINGLEIIPYAVYPQLLALLAALSILLRGRDGDGRTRAGEEGAARAPEGRSGAS